jgi:hypothetical protein
MALINLKNDVSETEICLHRWNLLCPAQWIETRSIDWAQQSGFYLGTETDYSLRNVAF